MKKQATKLFLAAHLLEISNLTSSGSKLYGYADQTVFYKTPGGSIQGVFSFIYNSKLHAVAICNDGGGVYFMFIPKSVLITQLGMPSAYVTGFVETADAALTLEAQSSSWTTGVRRVSNISQTDAQLAINSLNNIEKGTKILPTTEGYFHSTGGALPPSSALPITTADGTVPDKKITTLSEGEGDKGKDGDKPKTWFQKNWGYVVGAAAVVVVVVVIIIAKNN